MRNTRANRFTIFDVMEARGVFEDNPANAGSPDYVGPKPYPKMFYHPEGKEQITQRAEIVTTPMGPEKVGELREIISRTVQDADEEAAVRAAGWHDHPAKAIKAAGREVPAVVSFDREADLEAEIQRLQEQLKVAREAPKQPPVDPNDLPAIGKPSAAPPPLATPTAGLGVRK